MEREYPGDKLRLAFPFRMALFGASGAGKSHFISDLLTAVTRERETVFASAAHEKTENLGIVYCVRDRLPDNLKVPVHLQKGLAKISDLLALKERYNYDGIILILDDLMEDLKALQSNKEDSIEYTKLFIDGARTFNISCIVTFQLVYPDSTLGRVLIRNAEFQMFFSCPADHANIRRKLAAMFGRDGQYHFSAYKRAVASPTGYLCVDTQPKSSCPECLRRRNFLVPLVENSLLIPTTLAEPSRQYIFISPNDQNHLSDETSTTEEEEEEDEESSGETEDEGNNEALGDQEASILSL